MKYKLINKQTNEEHLCDKVTIDGCSYYVSNEKATEGFYGYINFQGGDIKKIGKYFADDWKKVIACNNPNIDIPKVVDDIEDGTYIEDVIFSKKECDEWLENNKETVYYLDKESLDKFWEEYPNGVIQFG